MVWTVTGRYGPAAVEFCDLLYQLKPIPAPAGERSNPRSPRANRSHPRGKAFLK
jgi:hypothetical protein